MSGAFGQTVVAAADRAHAVRRTATPTGLAAMDAVDREAAHEGRRASVRIVGAQRLEAI